MLVCKIEAPVLAKAIQEREFFALRVYLGEYFKEGGMFVSEIHYNEYSKKNEVDFRLSLFDYFSNEDEEVQRLLKLAEEMGYVKEDGPYISNKIIKVVEL